MATTHFRKTFRYPTDNSDDEDIPEHLDEEGEEQEKLIKNLQKEDDKQNEKFRHILLALPTISAIAFLPVLFTAQSLQARLLCLFSVTSLTCTAYILNFISHVSPKPQSGSLAKQEFAPYSRPIHRHISFLNGGLSILILLNAFNTRGKSGVPEGFWLLCILPALIFSVIVIARRIMLDVDVTELEDLKYGYKGA